MRDAQGARRLFQGLQTLVVVLFLLPAWHGGRACSADGPDIPEPMVFDLVRPLGAQRGEMEVNVLGVVPLIRRTRTFGEVPDPQGVIPRSRTLPTVGFSPELEVAVMDGVALEFEVPFEDGRLAAFKPALQVTFGTGLDNRFIHGAQVIGQYETEGRVWAPTAVYIAGYRFNPVWSMMGMAGARGEFGENTGKSRVELLFNLNVFADVGPRLVAGLETNYGQLIAGHAAVLIMHQLHYAWKKRWVLQAGIGTRLVSQSAIPEAAFRFIREF